MSEDAFTLSCCPLSTDIMFRGRPLIIWGGGPRADFHEWIFLFGDPLNIFFLKVVRTFFFQFPPPPRWLMADPLGLVMQFAVVRDGLILVSVYWHYFFFTILQYRYPPKLTICYIITHPVLAVSAVSTKASISMSTYWQKYGPFLTLEVIILLFVRCRTT